jgi:predicted permease
MATLLSPRGFRQDLRSAFRTMRRAAGLYLLLALVIGLGVGATTAVYSVVRPLLLAPLPVEDPAALVWIQNTGQGASLSSITSRSSNLRDFRALATSFEGITGYMAFSDQSTNTLMVGGELEQTFGFGVAADFLDVLGVEPLLGRSFTAEEGEWGGPRAILLTNGFWRRRFAGDADIIGATVQLDGQANEVIGVLPGTFDFASIFTPGKRVDFLTTFPVSDETDRWGNTMFFIGRLRPDVTASAAEQELQRVIGALKEQQPERWGLGARVTPLQTYIAAPIRPALRLLMAASAAVMLIVCFNVANILLARSPGRSREVAVRKALGATRGRIIRQLLVESMIFAAAGGLVGIAIALPVTRFLASATGMAIPLLDRITVDGPALAFALAAGIFAGLLAGSMPALKVAEGRESDTLRAASRGATGHRAGRRIREMLVVAELAVACVLLIAGGLLFRSFEAVLDVDLGFEPAGTVAWQLQPSRRFQSFDEMTTYYRTVTDRVEALPGIQSAGLIDGLPMGRNRSWGLQVVGANVDPDKPWTSLFPHMISPGYLETMGIPIVAGRAITAQDTDDTPHVVLINQTAAREIFAGEEPVGRQIVTGGGDEPWEIVGVVGDIRHLGPETEPGVQVYFPMAQMWDFSSLDLLVRSRLPAARVAAAVSATLAELDPAMPTRDYWTLESRLDRTVSARRFTLQVLGGFGFVALVLAALGIYGVLSQSVAERAREIGIRMSLGETAGSVRRSVVGRTLLLAGAGIGIGVIIAQAGSRLLASMLFGVRAADPVTLGSMAMILVAVAALSGLVPALRASRTDALAVLRAE